MQKKIKVLIIDDEPSVANALEMILQDNGYDTLVARNGREGLELARSQHVDVVVTDLRLPDISGLEVLKAFCEINPAGLMVLITAHGTPEVVAEATSCGAAGTLHKPFSPSDILSLITEALSKRVSAALQ